MALVWKPLSEATTAYTFENNGVESYFDTVGSTIEYLAGDALGYGKWQLFGTSTWNPAAPAVRLRFTPVDYTAGVGVTGVFYYTSSSGVFNGVQDNESATPQTEWLPDPFTVDVYAHSEMNEWNIEFDYDSDDAANYHLFYVEIEEEDGTGTGEPAYCFWADLLLATEECVPAPEGIPLELGVDAFPPVGETTVYLFTAPVTEPYGIYLWSDSGGGYGATAEIYNVTNDAPDGTLTTDGPTKTLFADEGMVYRITVTVEGDVAPGEIGLYVYMEAPK